jgi:hypothetical protein
VEILLADGEVVYFEYDIGLMYETWMEPPRV